MHFAKLLCVALLLTIPGCTFESNARRWNGTYGADGEKIFVKTLTRVGLNAFVILPFFGWTDTGTLVDQLTAEVRRDHGDYVRLVSVEAQRFWLGLVPISFFVTPVVATVAAEYRPGIELLERQEALDRNRWFMRTLSEAEDKRLR
jgi:hypothetical protein